MTHCLIHKFSYYTDLNKDERALLLQLEDRKISYKAGECIAAKGDPCDHLYILHDGWAYVSSTLDVKLRSIFDVRLNADFVGLSDLAFQHHLHDFYALTNVVVCPFPKKNLGAMFDQSPKLRDVFLLILSREQAIAKERVISIGRRTAIERVAHFLMELNVRHSLLYPSEDTVFDFPLTLDHMGDLLGLSPVHVSRSMSMLKENGYITYNRTRVKILQMDKLITMSGFNPVFLEKPERMIPQELEYAEA